jgi:hypothetical protein
MRDEYKNMALVDYGFPNYDDRLPVIEGFEDCSYKNDECPSISKDFGNQDYLVIHCDYKNPNKSTIHTDGEYFRFYLSLDRMMDENQLNPKMLGRFKTKNEVKQFIKGKTLQDFINMEEA